MNDFNPTVPLGQAGTGSAYILPNEAPSPFQMAQQYAQDYDIQRQKQQQQASQLGSVPGGLWDTDLTKYADMRQQLINSYADYLTKGVNPSNPKNKDAYLDIQKKLNGLNSYVTLSKQQKATHDELQKYYQEHPENYDPQSAQNLDYFRHSLTPVERANFNTSQILIPKQKQIDWNDYRNDYLKDLKPDENGSYYKDFKNDALVNTTTKSYKPGTSLYAANNLYYGKDKNGTSAKGYVDAMYDSLPDTDKQHFEAVAEKKGIPPQVAFVEEREVLPRLPDTVERKATSLGNENSWGAGFEDNAAAAKDLVRKTQDTVNGRGYMDYATVKGEPQEKGTPGWDGKSYMRANFALHGVPIGEESLGFGGKKPITINYVEEKKDGTKVIHLSNNQTMPLTSAMNNIIKPHLEYTGIGDKYKQAVQHWIIQKGITDQTGRENWVDNEGQPDPNAPTRLFVKTSTKPAFLK